MTELPQQSPRPGSGGKRVLPPISSEVERQFIQDLQENVYVEMARLNCPDQGPDEQRYIIYKDAFNKLIEHVTAYRPLLTAIKAEYENCIETIERGQKESFYLSGKVKAMAAEQTTLNYYQRRTDELQHRMAVVHADNEKLREELESLQETQEELDGIPEQDVDEVSSKKSKVYTLPDKLIPGLSLEESTDMVCLQRKIEECQQLVQNLKQSKQTRYAPRRQKEQLKHQLASKSKAKEHVSEQNLHLKARCLKLRVALDTLKAYYKDSQHSFTSFSPAEAVALALARSGSKMSVNSADTATTFDDDDPTKEREAEMLLEYIEHFNDLFEEGRYSDAAMHAANSPKGILRNPETLARFKAIHVKPGKLSPLLAYCEALMSSVPAVGILPNAETSLECVKSALQEDRLDLVTHWIAQKRLTCSEPLGHLLYNYTQGKNTEIVNKCLPLAQAVYTKVGAHIQSAVCMCKQGRVRAMMEYAHNAKFSKDAYVGVLVACPTLALAEVLVQPYGDSNTPVLPVGTVVSELLRTESHQVGVQLLDKIHSNIQSGTSHPSLKDIVFSDPTTNIHAWLQIIRSCQDSGLYDVGIELLAAVTVLEAIKKATSSPT
ncbi:clathrin heavy chain linker domain-containing protein 1-like [Amphiura filiformis]|uniref:clathrin heavy chain linker domain-containing protein 1-like n=1 Tax=Amphiura filiformis TaxID=82378 RepID=UPI003B21A799